MDPNHYHDCKHELLLYTRDRLREALERSLRRRSAAATALDEGAATLRTQLLDVLGLPSGSYRDRVRPRVERLGSLESEGLLVERVLLYGEDRLGITCNLYKLNKPNTSGRGPAVLFLCGHDVLAKAAPQYQAAARTLARAGMQVLVMDPVGQGERIAYPDEAPSGANPLWCMPGTSEHTLGGLSALFLGESSSRRFVADALTALRYLAEQEDVDETRLGVTGNSGAGLQSLLLAAVCPEIRAVATGTFVSSRQRIFDSGVPQDAEQCLPAVEQAAWDHTDLLYLVAPRPCLVLAAEDDFFPLVGTRETVRDAAAFWPGPVQANGADAGLEPVQKPGLKLFVDRGGHRYSEAMAREASSFFSEVFSADQDTLYAHSHEHVLQTEYLNCLPSGHLYRDRPYERRWLDVEAERRLGDTFLAEELIRKRLREQVFRGRDEEAAISFVRYKNETRLPEGLGGLDLTYVLWESATGLHNYGLVARRQATSGKTKSDRAEYADYLIDPELPLFYKLVEELRLEEDEDVLTALRSGQQVFLHVPTAAGRISPHEIGGRDLNGLFGARNKLCMDLIAAGDSLAAIRVYDAYILLKSIQAMTSNEASPGIVVNSDEDYSWYVRLLELLMPVIKTRITRTTRTNRSDAESIEAWVDRLCPPQRYRPDRLPEYILPGILRRTDS